MNATDATEMLNEYFRWDFAEMPFNCAMPNVYINNTRIIRSTALYPNEPLNSFGKVLCLLLPVCLVLLYFARISANLHCYTLEAPLLHVAISPRKAPLLSYVSGVSQSELQHTVFAAQKS